MRGNQRSAGQGDPEAKARLLAELVRIGSLSEARVQLAAKLGHATAMQRHPKIRRASNPLAVLAGDDYRGLVIDVLLKIMEAIVARWQIDLGGVLDEELRLSETDLDEVEYEDIKREIELEGMEAHHVAMAARFILTPSERLISTLRPSSALNTHELPQNLGDDPLVFPPGAPVASRYGYNLFNGCVQAWRLLNQTQVAIDWRDLRAFLNRLFKAYCTFERVCSKSTVIEAQERCRDYIRDCAIVHLLPDL